MIKIKLIRHFYVVHMDIIFSLVVYGIVSVFADITKWKVALNVQL